MDPYVLRSMAGIAPKIAPRLLPPNFAQRANNCKFESGELNPWRRPLAVAVPTKATLGTVQSIYRLEANNTEYWLNWLTDVNVVFEPIEAGDDRLFWTGDGEPRVATETQAVVGPDYPTQFYVLGVHQPTVAPTVTPSGGVGAANTRAYLYTFVTATGEESAASPASAAVVGKVDDTWALTLLEADPPNAGTVVDALHSGGVVTVELNTTRGLRAGEEITIAAVVGMTDLNGKHTIASVVNATDITIELSTAQTYISGGTWTRVAAHNVQNKRIYRTKQGASTSEWFLVAEIAAATASYNDTILDADLVSVLESEDWEMPPATMTGLISLGNQVLAGFFHKTLCFSEPGVPYAWPARYRKTCPHHIVFIAVYDNMIYVLTDEEVWVAIGNTPDSITFEPTKFLQPCLSKRSAAASPIGIFYASPDGACLVGPGGFGVATESMIDRDQWQEMSPESMLGAFYDNRYFVWHELDTDGLPGLIVDRSSGEPYLARMSYLVNAVHLDRKSLDLYVIHDGEIKQWDANPYNKMPLDWVSKILVSPRPVNPTIVRVHADYDALGLNADSAERAAQRALDIVYNDAILLTGITEGEVNASPVNLYAVNGSLLRGLSDSYDQRYLTFTLTANKSVKKIKNLTSSKAFRLPDGYAATDFEIGLSGNINIHSVEIAGGSETLKLV